MQGKRNEVAKRIRADAPAAVTVHCLAHSLNLCLQDPLRDAIDIVREIVKLNAHQGYKRH